MASSLSSLNLKLQALHAWQGYKLNCKHETAVHGPYESPKLQNSEENRFATRVEGLCVEGLAILSPEPLNLTS